MTVIVSSLSAKSTAHVTATARVAPATRHTTATAGAATSKSRKKLAVHWTVDTRSRRSTGVIK